jgi:hypothetical protein
VSPVEAVVVAVPSLKEWNEMGLDRIGWMILFSLDLSSPRFVRYVLLMGTWNYSNLCLDPTWEDKPWEVNSIQPW